MIFAEVTATEAILVSVVSVLTTALGGLGAWLYTVMKARREAKRQDRVDTIMEWQNYANRLQDDFKGLQAEVSRLQQSERECLKRDGDAREKLARQEGTIAGLTADVRRLQAINRDTHPGVTVPTILIAGVDGIIYDATAAAGPMFHYLAADLRGKKVEILIPERFRGKYHEALAAIAAGTKQVDPGRVVMTQALRRDGTEFDVAINLSYWKSPRGSEFISAEIREQPSVGDKAVTMHGPDPAANT